jgi:hypothetical protein
MRKLGGLVVAAGCAYELVALTSRRLPTISELSWRLRDRHPVGAAAIWGGLGILGWHLLIDDSRTSKNAEK